MTLKYLNGNQKNFEKKLEILLDQRRIQEPNKLFLVKKIIADIRKNKDQALIKYEKKFTKIKKINTYNLKFTKSEIKKTLNKLDKKTKKSIDLAFNRIFKFHKKQSQNNYKLIDNYNNQLSYSSSPIKKVGIYVYFLQINVKKT